MDACWAPLGLFLSAFLAATILPGGSEPVLAALVAKQPGQLELLLSVATLGNTLGGMSSYLVGYLLARPVDARALAQLRRWGSPLLVLSWLPVLGDALCVGAGLLRLAPVHAALWMALGKGLRYWAVALVALEAGEALP